MKIEKIAKKKQKDLTFKDLEIGDVFRDASSGVILMKMREVVIDRSRVNVINLERSTYVYRAERDRVIRVDATLVVKE